MPVVSKWWSENTAETQKRILDPSVNQSENPFEYPLSLSQNEWIHQLGGNSADIAEMSREIANLQLEIRGLKEEKEASELEKRLT